jgi:hypothetical protein
MNMLATKDETQSATHVLDITIAQILNAIESGNKEMQTFSGNFIEAAALIDSIEEKIGGFNSEEATSELEPAVDEAKAKIHQSIANAQFYDRLVQRLNHVIIGLKYLKGHLSVINDADAKILFEEITSCFTLEDEKQLISSIISRGEKEVTAETQSKNNNDSVELF